MAYVKKYYKEFDGYNAATRQAYSVLVDIYEDGFAGAAIEIEKVSASPLQLALDSDGDPLYTAIKKTSAAFNIINTGQFDYSEFYTSNAKKYKMMITSTVFNWTGYLVPQAVSFDLATNGEFTLTASDGLHLLQSIDYKANENETTTLAAFLTDIETKIGLSTFNRTSTVNTEYGDIWNSLIYKGMLVGKTYEEAFEMVLKAIGMQVRYWKITPIISIESAFQTASVKCVNDYPELNFLAPIKTAKLTKQITTLPNALKNAMVDDVTDLTPRLGGYYTLSNWVIAANNGLPVQVGELPINTQTEKYNAINVFAKPTNLPYDVSLSGDMHSYFNVRPIRSSQFTLVFSANFGKLGLYAKFVTGEGFKFFPVPVKWSTIRWSLYDSETNRSFNKTSGVWDIVGVPTKATSNEIKVTNPADSDVDVIVEVASPTSIVSKLRFYLFTSDFEASSVPELYGTQFSRLSIKNIKLDGVEIVSDNELYTATIGNVQVGENIDKLNYEVELGSVPTPPLNTSLYYGSALFDNNLNQLEDIIIGANTVSHEQYLFNTILYTQNEIRKKVYTANVNMLSNVSPFWLKTTLKSDVVMVNACSFDFKTSQLNGEFTEIMPYTYREWTITSESEIGSSDWGGSGGTTGTIGGGGTVDTSNFVVKTGATDQAIEGIVRPDNLLSNGAVVAKSLAPTDAAEWPQAGTGVKGVVKYDGTTIALNANGQLTVIGGGSGGTSAWGTPTSQYTPLTVDSITRNLSLDGHTHNYLPLSGGNLTGALTISGSTVWHSGNDGAGSGLDADTVDGIHLSAILPYGTIRDFPNGTLIQTSINYPVSNGSPFYLEIKGNTYTRIYSCFTQAQGYIYNNSIINYSVTHLGFNGINNLTAFNYNGNLCFWFPNQGYWEGYSITVYDANDSKYNRVTSVSNEAKPTGITKEVIISSQTKSTAFTDSNVASATKLQTTRSIWGQNFNGEGNVDGTLSTRNYSTEYYTEGIRIHAGNTGGWCALMLCGKDNTGDQGTSPNSWGIFNSNTNNFYINRCYSERSTGYELCNVNGNWGIGTTSPSYKLDVSGTGRFTGNVTAPTFVGNLTGNASTATQTTANVAAGTTHNLLYSLMADNDYFRVMVGGASNGGYAEIATADDGSEPIYIRQYIGYFDKLLRTATLLDENGNTNFPGALSASRVIAGFDSGYAGSISCSNWFRSNGASGWYNETYGAGILSDTANVVRTYSTNKFKVYNTTSDSIYTLGGILANGSVVAKYLSSTFATDWPVMTSSVQGVAKAGASLIANAGTLDQRSRHYTTVTSYTDAAARDITAEIPIGTGSLLHTEAMSLQLPFLPSSTTKTVTGNILINPTTWSGTGLNVTFLDNGTNYVAFITNYSGSTITKDGIKITIMAKQTV